MVQQHIILAFSWILFCFLHSFLAGIQFKKRLFAHLKKHYKFYRLYYILFAFFSFAAVLLYQLSISSPFVFHRLFATTVFGVFMYSAGLVIMAICIRKYFMQLSGLQTLFIDELKTGNHLLITGVHRYVRHPLYLGTFLFIWGLFLLLPYLSLLISNVIITVYTLMAIRFEEEKLLQEFGRAYQNYRQKVPKILPFRKPYPEQ